MKHMQEVLEEEPSGESHRTSELDPSVPVGLVQSRSCSCSIRVPWDELSP